MDGASGLCEPHFEAQREEIKARLAAAGPTPVIKQAPKRKNQPEHGLQAKPKQNIWAALAVVALAVFATFHYSGDSTPPSPTSFSQASADETWSINVDNIAILKAPEIPASKIEFMAATIAILQPGEQVLIIKGARSDSWKQVLLLSRPSQSGWVLADTVRSASLVGRL